MYSQPSHVLDPSGAEQLPQTPMDTNKNADFHAQTSTPNHEVTPLNTSLLDSYGTRPQISWTPSPFLLQHSGIDQPLFSAPILTDDRRAEILEQYAPIKNLSYKPPLGLPQVSLNKFQQVEDQALRNLQYLHSGVFRPFDIFLSEFLTEFNTHPNFPVYVQILQDIRLLLLNTASTMTHYRNKIALYSVNPHIHVPNPAQQPTRIMSDTDFQQALLQHAATTKATRDACPKPKHRNFSNGPDTQFFRFGPSPQRGGCRI